MVPENETSADRLARAEREGMTFEACRFGERVSTCYHVPRCKHEIPGFGRFFTDAPKPGMQFVHARFLDPRGGSEKARCTVTSVRHGRVYWTYTYEYDAGDTRGAWYFKAEDVRGFVGAWL